MSKREFNLTAEEKIRLLCGVGSWKTSSCNGKLPQVVMSDGPHGLRKQEVENYSDINDSKIATCFPAAVTVASTWNPDMAALLAGSLAKEAKYEHVDIVLGPGINIKRSPLCGRNFEYYSEDPYLAGACAAAYVKTMEDAGVATSLKHFACNNQETRRMTSNSVVDEQTLFEIYLSAFERVVKQGKPSTIMSSYNRLNGTKVSANHFLLTDVLRERWGFEGLVVSDWGAAVGILDCIKAGMNLEMPDSFGHHTAELMEAYKKGELTDEELDRAIEPILKLAERKLDQDGKDIPALEGLYEKNHEAALQIACEGAVLLKKGTKFPLKKDKKVVIVGQMAKELRIQGGGSSHIKCLERPNVVQALESLGYEVTYFDGYPVDTDETNQTLCGEAIAALKSVGEDAQVLFFCGLTDLYESEGYDRKSLTIPGNQLSLWKEIVKLGQKPSVVCFGGSPFDMEFYDEADDILMMYLGGQATGEACAKLLSGEANPSGKLAETWPLKIEDTPCYGSFASSDANVYYKEGIFVGYRHYETKKIPVRFEFGYGLSYTEFAYKDIAVSEKDGKTVVSFTLQNVGEYAGSEVSQIYVAPKGVAAQNRPAVELRGFAKTFLMPKEEKRVEIPLDYRAFMVYDTQVHEFVKSAGEYDILVGASVRDIKLSESIQVAAGETVTDSGKPFHWPTECTIKNPEERLLEMGDDFETICKQSFVGNLVRNVLFALLPLGIKGGKKSSAYAIIVAVFNEAPMESLPALSNNLLKAGFLRWLLKQANKKKQE